MGREAWRSPCFSGGAVVDVGVVHVVDIDEMLLALLLLLLMEGTKRYEGVVTRLVGGDELNNPGR